MAASLQDLHDEILTCTQCSPFLPREQLVPRSGFPPSGLYSVILIGPEPNPSARQRRTPEAYRDTFDPRIKGHRNKIRNLFKALMTGGIPFESVFFTNAVKCPSDGAQSIPCLTHCLPFLAQQIAAIQPRVLIAVGRGAERIGFSRARKGEIGRYTYEGCPTLVTTHPQGARTEYLNEIARTAARLLGRPSVGPCSTN